LLRYKGFAVEELQLHPLCLANEQIKLVKKAGWCPPEMASFNREGYDAEMRVA